MGNIEKATLILLSLAINILNSSCKEMCSLQDWFDEMKAIDGFDGELNEEQKSVRKKCYGMLKKNPKAKVSCDLLKSYEDILLPVDDDIFDDEDGNDNPSADDENQNVMDETKADGIELSKNENILSDEILTDSFVDDADGTSVDIDNLADKEILINDEEKNKMVDEDEIDQNNIIDDDGLDELEDADNSYSDDDLNIYTESNSDEIDLKMNEEDPLLEDELVNVNQYNQEEHEVTHESFSDEDHNSKDETNSNDEWYVDDDDNNDDYEDDDGAIDDINDHDFQLSPDHNDNHSYRMVSNIYSLFWQKCFHDHEFTSLLCRYLCSLYHVIDTNKDGFQYQSNKEGVNAYSAQEDSLVLENKHDIHNNEKSSIKLHGIELKMLKIENMLLREKNKDDINMVDFYKMESNIYKLENEMMKLNHSIFAIKEENKHVASMKTNTENVNALTKADKNTLTGLENTTFILEAHHVEINKLHETLKSHGNLLESIQQRVDRFESEKHFLFESMMNQSKIISEMTASIHELKRGIELQGIKEFINSLNFHHLGAVQPQKPDVTNHVELESDKNKKSSLREDYHVKIHPEDSDEDQVIQNDDGSQKDNKQTSLSNDDGLIKETEQTSLLNEDGSIKENKQTKLLNDDGFIKETKQSSPLNEDGSIKENKQAKLLNDDGSIKETKQSSPLNDDGSIKGNKQTSILNDDISKKENKQPSHLNDDGSKKENKQTSLSNDEIKSSFTESAKQETKNEKKNGNSKNVIKSDKKTNSSKTNRNEQKVSKSERSENNKANSVKKNNQELKKKENKVVDDKKSNTKTIKDSSNSGKIAKTAAAKEKTPPKPAAPKEKTPPKPLYYKEGYDGIKDCYDAYSSGRKKDTAIKIRPVGGTKEIDVFCDMQNGGWTIFQRRQDGSTDFFKDWKDYKIGFGGIYGEHWLGNDLLHLLTNQGSYSLRVDMMDWDRNKAFAIYENFRVEDESKGYRLHISGYNGTSGDSLLKHNGLKFSTKDVDNDLATPKDVGGSCAKRFHGSWWYYKCYMSNPNGKYYRGGITTPKMFDGITWKSWRNSSVSLKKIEMKIRPQLTATILS